MQLKSHCCWVFDHNNAATWVRGKWSQASGVQSPESESPEWEVEDVVPMHAPTWDGIHPFQWVSGIYVKGSGDISRALYLKMVQPRQGGMDYIEFVSLGKVSETMLACFANRGPTGQNFKPRRNYAGWVVL